MIIVFAIVVADVVDFAMIVVFFFSSSRSLLIKQSIRMFTVEFYSGIRLSQKNLKGIVNIKAYR